MSRITRTIASTLALAITTGAVFTGATAAGAQDGSNNSYATPTVLPSQPAGQVTGNNVGATLEPGETPLGGNGRSSVHYSIVAPATGPLRVSTVGSTYDTQLGIGTGDSVGSFTLLAQNDDANPQLTSEVTVNAVQGQTYRIVVDGFGGAQGTHNLSWNLAAAPQPAAAPGNDGFATPTVLPSDMAGQVTGNNTGATLEAGEPRVANVGGRSVHYSIVAPVTGTLRLSTAGSAYDSALGAGQGASAAGLVFAAQNDDANGGRQSEVTINVTAGQTYRIVVDGYRGAEGAHTLAWTFTGQTPNGNQNPGGNQTPGGNQNPEPNQDMQARFLALINQARSQARSCGADAMPAVPPVATDALLVEASRVHSQDMATNNFFSHTGSDGSSFSQRARIIGTTANGENISAGSTDVAAVVQGWLDSPGHCRNIMSPNATRVGVALVSNPGTQWTNYWTMMTGA